MITSDTEADLMHAYIKANPFAAWSAVANGSIVVNHLPFHLQVLADGQAVLRGHVARRNKIWQAQCDSNDSVIVFQSHDAYVSPSWYPSKQQHGKAVPTWNYIAVHAYGQPRFVQDKEWLLNHLNELTYDQERDLSDPWKIDDAPREFIEKLADAIIGVEIPVQRLEANFKLGVHRSVEDQQGVIDGLSTLRQKSDLLAYLRDQLLEQ